MLILRDVAEYYLILVSNRGKRKTKVLHKEQSARNAKDDINQLFATEPLQLGTRTSKESAYEKVRCQYCKIFILLDFEAEKDTHSCAGGVFGRSS